LHLHVLVSAGQNEQVRIALGQPAIRGRGLRVLAMDGGGMKGMAMVELLRQLERRAGAPIWSLFDVIGGTSTGGLLAVATGILRLNLDECQDIYTKLGNKVCMSVAVCCKAASVWRCVACICTNPAEWTCQLPTTQVKHACATYIVSFSSCLYCMPV
jgi:hypothetical protein